MCLVLPVWSAVDWDHVLDDYLNFLYDKQCSVEGCSRILAAVLWAEPHLGATIRATFPVASRALAGWRKLQPARSRPPLPYEVMMMIAETLIL